MRQRPRQKSDPKTTEHETKQTGSKQQKTEKNKTLEPTLPKSGAYSFNFSAIEKATVLYYLVHNNKLEAYKIYAEATGKSLNPSTVSTMSAKFFKTEKIKTILAIENQKLIDALESIRVNLGLKNAEAGKSKISGGNELELTKKEVLNLLNRLIRSNSNDTKAIKELIPHLIKLNQWDKDQTEHKSNITFYDLPIKQQL